MHRCAGVESVQLRELSIQVEMDSVLLETEGIKHSTPLNYFACFSDSSFCCLEELHLWGHHAAKQLWYLITTKDALSLTDSRNVPALKPQFRKPIAEAMVEAEKQSRSGAFDGKSIDLEAKSGHARGVDWISFLLHVLPNILPDAYLEQNYKSSQ
ncbi:hypothetical protein A0J61_10810, partial [Choanephora cucurbitarum]